MNVRGLYGIVILCFLMFAVLIFSGCDGVGSGVDNGGKPGTITINLSDAGGFDGYNVRYEIYDSDEVSEEGELTGNLLGSYEITVAGGSVTCRITDEHDEEIIFEPGVYYLKAVADLDDSSFTITSGDKILWPKPVSLDGEVSVGITEEDFDITVYEPGDTGPAGGFVFYFNLKHAADGWCCLEAAPDDQSIGIVWNDKENNYFVGYGDGMGKGKTNTEEIVAAQGEGSYAAKLCTDLNVDGYKGWYLPTISELIEMYEKLHLENIGDFSDDWYWSSSAQSWTMARRLNFGNAQGYNDVSTGLKKDDQHRVRAIRAF